MPVTIHDPKNPQSQPPLALFNLGFRPFFLFASLFAVVTMALWGLVYGGVIAFDSGQLTLFQWHAHEMLFGYATAVIAGFLLTSVRNWTGRPTPVGNKLALMVVFWLAARLAFAFGGQTLVMAALFNLFFMVALVVSIGEKIVRVRQWRQLGIVAVVTLLALGELAVVIGMIQKNQWLVSKAIYAAFYLVILLILIMGRRVVPFFIERGVGYTISLRQSKVLDTGIVAGFLAYALAILLGTDFRIQAGLAALLFVAQSVRLIFWYTHGIWRKPLLWSLYLGLVFIDLGFLLAALGAWLQISGYLSLHALAVGGIGIVTLSMMARVSLGHTGRDVHQAPHAVTLALVLLILAVLLRVFLPLLAPGNYALWIGLAQVAWILSFSLFTANYAPILFRPRADGQAG